MPNIALTARYVSVVNTIGQEWAETSTPEVVVRLTKFVPVVYDGKLVPVLVVSLPVILIHEVHFLTFDLAGISYEWVNILHIWCGTYLNQEQSDVPFQLVPVS